MKQLRKIEIKRKFKEYKRDKEIYVILENIQYASNVALMFRVADAAGVRRVYLSGITTTPPFGKELKEISRSKEQSVEWQYRKESGKLIDDLRNKGFKIISVEITDESKELHELKDLIKNDEKVCFIVGSEVNGIKKDTLERSNFAVSIPMYGKGASLNVSVSLAVILFSI